MDDAQLRTVWQQRQFNDGVAHLGGLLGALLKRDLAKRVRQLSRLAEIWDELVPPEIAEHTALESFARGVLTVLVDSSPHRFQLQMLLSGGLQRDIQARFSGALNRVRLLPGAFQAVEITPPIPPILP